MAHELTDEDKAQLGRILEAHNNKGGSDVDPNRLDCQKIRGMYHAGKYLDEICEKVNGTKDSVRKHVSGKCNCNVDMQSIEYENHSVNHIKIHCPYCDADYHYYDDLSSHINTVHE